MNLVICIIYVILNSIMWYMVGVIHTEIKREEEEDEENEKQG